MAILDYLPELKRGQGQLIAIVGLLLSNFLRSSIFDVNLYSIPVLFI